METVVVEYESEPKRKRLWHVVWFADSEVLYTRR